MHDDGQHEGSGAPLATAGPTPEGSSGAPDDEAAMRRAEAAVAELAAQYPEWAARHVANLEAACREARASPAEQAEQLRRIFDLAHDVKGEGSTYGYPLMTRLGASLCRFLRRLKRCGEVELAIVEKHIQAMCVVIRDRVEGEGGAQAREVAALLEEAVTKFGG